MADADALVAADLGPNYDAVVSANRLAVGHAFGSAICGSDAHSAAAADAVAHRAALDDANERTDNAAIVDAFGCAIAASVCRADDAADCGPVRSVF